MKLARALALVAPIVLLAPAARADILPDGKEQVYAAVTIDGLDAAKDQSLVIVGCNPDAGGGRHQIAFASADKSSLRCRFKMPAPVYLVAKKDLKPFEDLVAKDVGWGEEGMQARKLLEKAPTCGTMWTNTLVDRGSTKEVSAKFRFEKVASGCAIKAVAAEAATAPATASASASAAPSASASASAVAPTTASAAPAAPSASAPAAPSAPAQPKSGCASAPGHVGSVEAFGLALGLVALARRRRR